MHRHVSLRFFAVLALFFTGAGIASASCITTVVGRSPSPELSLPVNSAVQPALNYPFRVGVYNTTPITQSNAAIFAIDASGFRNTLAGGKTAFLLTTSGIPSIARETLLSAGAAGGIKAVANWVYFAQGF